ncbi:glycoside hydrolase superfamily [Cantharellus anzutake]|uniref:glycoside hydrolase superfamily n=1 Tax=Cantharellus anzutake TaxID=1750568 RepID=UPI00190679F3|nr:glycoside hydrolase superfamily [Cantharellus anzutake]KAF8329749.1 glycoside hydrolase superfamily [Cantharellus anzutake]
MDDSAVVAHHATLEDKRAQYMAPNVQKRKRIRNIVIGALAVLLALAVALGALYFFVLRKHSSNKDNTTSGGGSGSSLTGGSPTRTSSGASPSNTVRVTGGDGSVVTFEDGSTMVYRNSFAGTWYYDPNDPFNNNAQAQSWTPPLNTTFKFGTNKIRGVNLGGWLNTEPFISPALYEKYLDASTPAIDEWTLSTNMAADKASGGLGQLENHYATFITEEDFALIAAAGLNFVRIPFPYWAISVFPGEPFLEGTAWKYFLKAIQWARKYGIRINLDLHAIPGSQNAFNHSGKFGLVNWLYGTMGLANAQRSLDIIRILVEFISQLQYSPVIPVFGLVNEPLAPSIGIDVLGSFYLQAYYMIRNITGVGTGKGPFITIHDGFLPINGWYGFLSGADRIMLDTHPYLCFQALDPSPPSQQAGRPCGAWAGRINQTMQNFGMVNAGEWSLGYTDCGLFLNGVGLGTRYEGNLSTFPSTRIGSCAPVLDWENYNQSTKSGLMAFGLAQMDVLQNWFFWTWKIGNSSVSGRVESPHWSYRLGWENGWLPKDPRSASGVCASQGVTTLWTPPLAAWQTGGQGAGTIAAGQLQTYGAWPPTTMSPSVNNVQALPQYTPTGSLPTLPVPTFTGSVASTVSPGDGWYDSSDTVGYYTSIQGCSYPNGWSAVSAPIPTGCGGSARKRNGGQVVAAAAAGPPWATITPSPRLR